VAAFEKSTAKDPFNAQTAAPSGSLASADPSAPPNSNVPAAKSPCYRVQTTIGYADGRRSVSEVVIVLGDKTEPYRVLAWQDDVKPANPPIVRRRL
jgi:general secretion pathway protein K